jgi:hypothetical protein
LIDSVSEDDQVKSQQKKKKEEAGGHVQGQEEFTRKCFCKVEDSKISFATDGSVLMGGIEGDKNGRCKTQN